MEFYQPIRITWNYIDYSEAFVLGEGDRMRELKQCLWNQSSIIFLNIII